MNNIDTSQLLSQLRVASMQARAASPAQTQAVQGSDSASFSSFLNQSINKVNELQQNSSQLTNSFQLGDPNVSLAQVMVAKGKAGLAFEGMVQVRNKMIDAYQEIMRMQV